MKNKQTNTHTKTIHNIIWDTCYVKYTGKSGRIQLKQDHSPYSEAFFAETLSSLADYLGQKLEGTHKSVRWHSSWKHLKD